MKTHRKIHLKGCYYSVNLKIFIVAGYSGSDWYEDDGEVDSAASTQNSATPTQDSATPTQDLATPTQDSATPTQDSATPTQDSATPAQDSVLLHP